MFEKFNIKRFVLCADDFGANLGINRGILTLAEMGYITAVSCLTTAEFFASDAKALKNSANKIDIGVHLNLTEGKPISKLFKDYYGDRLFSFSKLLRLCWLRRVNLEAIEAEWLAQIEEFVLRMGMMPDFFDGHQHVHQLPFLHDTFIRVVQTCRERFSNHLYVRWVELDSSLGSFKSRLKARIANYLLAPARAKKALEAKKIPHNDAFSGMYAFDDKAAYAACFPQFLKVLKLGTVPIIMCHPAALGLACDPLSLRRVEEFIYLKSLACRKAYVELSGLMTQFYA